jgi:hypothetical protein
MRRTRILFAVMVALALVGFGAAATQAAPIPKTTGSVELSGPMQYVSFDAFESAPVKGSVRYTNFGYAVDGTGVWVPENFAMGFAVDPSTGIAATYSMTVDSFRPASPTTVTFTGTGDSGVGWISTFTGTITGSNFSLTMTEINAVNPTETYRLTATGAIASGGAVNGTWQDNFGGSRTGTFAIADIGHEVFHYVAPVTSVEVGSTGALFSYTIPAGTPLAGTVVYVHVTDGGSPGAGNDTLGFGTSLSSIAPYTIVGGNLTVFP